MFKEHGFNMTNRESYIRVFIASAMTLYAFISDSFIVGIVAIIIFYTAYSRFCFMYYIFKINERFSKKNYFLTLLPKYRTLPVFIFDEHGDIVFENDPALQICSEINHISALYTKDCVKLIKQGIKDSVMYAYQRRHFQVEIIPVQKDKLVLAYFTDISEVLALNDAIEETQREVIYAMGEIGETRSKETGNHVKRVAYYSKELALLYGLSEEEANKLQMASPMHDIGKVGIPDAILNAPRKLTEKEFEIMKTHAELGYKMLKNSNKPILQAAAIVANEHHEKWDGSGYPNATKGEDIHIYGRITAIADVFDALGSERVYKKAWELEKILELFKEQSSKHFDPKLVQLFLNNLDIFLKIRSQFEDVKL